MLLSDTAVPISPMRFFILWTSFPFVCAERGLSQHQSAIPTSAPLSAPCPNAFSSLQERDCIIFSMEPLLYRDAIPCAGLMNAGARRVRILKAHCPGSSITWECLIRLRATVSHGFVRRSMSLSWLSKDTSQ